ncbi:helix-turn-helix domain-containing protein [Lewinella sp. W8]|uniref:helix-turn-helix domain-containing protein n=1 Tax=Lewinella sp. W8 TaxID=2528208 RepID=UPI0010686FE0|nr:helix-turn-helix transcriptional regulator [Lewinella sp. W8]MTB51852.1 helix-turn-helix domain-containing protein [Lewinella sp. W8]
MEIEEVTPSEVRTPTALPNFIASNIRLLRKRLGWSQSELADRVNLNRGNIASYESGSAEPSICKLLRISNVFHVTTRDITRLDLRDKDQLLLAKRTHAAEARKENERFLAFRDRADELGELVSSSRKLFDYKRSHLENPCKEAEIFAVQYQQLYEVTQQLMKEHQELLGSLGCQCKQ